MSKRRHRQGHPGRERIKPKDKIKARVEAEQQKLREVQEHRLEISNLVKSLTERGVDIPREQIATMSAVEALTDILVDKGLVDRTDVNLLRFRNSQKHLEKLDRQTQPREEAATA